MTSILASIPVVAFVLGLIAWKIYRDRRGPPKIFDNGHPGGRIVPPGTPIRDVLREIPPDREDPRPTQGTNDPSTPRPAAFKPAGLGAYRPGMFSGHWPWSRFASLDAEMALLGAMILDNHVIGEVFGFVHRSEMFHSRANGAVFDAIVALHLRRNPIDPLTLREELARRKQLDAVGGSGFLASLIEATPTPRSALVYARDVFEAFLFREAVRSFRQTDMAVGHGARLADLRDKAEKALFRSRASRESAAI